MSKELVKYKTKYYDTSGIYSKENSKKLDEILERFNYQSIRLENNLKTFTFEYKIDSTGSWFQPLLIMSGWDKECYLGMIVIYYYEQAKCISYYDIFSKNTRNIESVEFSDYEIGDTYKKSNISITFNNTMWGGIRIFSI